MMIMARQQSLRRALGALKDTTKVGLAKVNSDYKDLDIAIVKATNHVECPPKDRHVKSIYAATLPMRPRTDVIYCIEALGRRLAKTHNWTVALKTLIVTHRLLREGDPTFREELCNYTHSRGHILNMSNFKDESSPIAWDYSAWVRTYALFLEERLECLHVLKYDVETERILGHSKTRDLRTEELLEQIPALQQLMYRLLSCKPEGASIRNFVIQYALSLVIKESFKLYCVINDGIISLVDKFFEMPRHDALTILDIYKRTGQQTEKLSEFYDTCKGLELARSFQFPSLAQLPQSFLATMEEYVKEAPRGLALPIDLTDSENGIFGPPRLLITYRENDDEADREPPSPDPVGPVSTETALPNLHREDANGFNSESGDLLGLGNQHPDASALEESNAFALAIVPTGITSNGTSAFYDPDSGTTGWELSLVTASSSNESALASSQLAGGMDKMTLDSLYENAITIQPQYGYPVSTNPFDMGPPPQQEDPFLASAKIAPPTGVQMANMAQHQHAFLQQQQQQQMMTSGIPNVPTNPFGGPMDFRFPNTTPNTYQNNPFGNPGLI